MELYLNVFSFLANASATEDTVTLDCSRVTFIKSFALVYLGLAALNAGRKGLRINWSPPSRTQVRSYLDGQHFNERFIRQSLPDAAVRMGLVNQSSLNDIVPISNDEAQARQLAVKIKALLDNRDNRVALNTSVVSNHVLELAHNFIHHSVSRDGFFHCQYYPNLREYHFTFGDLGCGIRSSLLRSGQYTEESFASVQDWIEEAARSGVSTRASGGGYGLDQLVEWILKEQGILIMASGCGYLGAYKGQMKKGPLPYDLPGLQIGVVLMEVDDGVRPVN